jgi:alkylhydroperoxidase family enzyme
LLGYSEKLTRSPGAMVEADLEPLRAAGLSDEDILDANLTVAYFAYVNRIADGLGVKLDGYMSGGNG